jgi:hypothetical protein
MFILFVPGVPAAESAKRRQTGGFEAAGLLMLAGAII